MSAPPWQGEGADVPDEALVAAFTAGGPDAHAAFDRLVARHEQRVYAICFRYFGNAVDAEDAAQDTFVALLRRAGSFQGTARFSTWLYRVAVNACNDIARRRARRPRVEGDGSVTLANLAEPDDPLAARELSLELQRALSQLDPVTRDAIVLHDVQGLPYADVAARLDLRVGTVKSRIHRGHARLAGLLRTLSPPSLAGASEQGEPSPPPAPHSRQP